MSDQDQDQDRWAALARELGLEPSSPPQAPRPKPPVSAEKTMEVAEKPAPPVEREVAPPRGQRQPIAAPEAAELPSAQEPQPSAEPSAPAAQAEGEEDRPSRGRRRG